ncbi:hypothetical protein AX15_004532 [Amanita polypyramis BW_CC]|nr:hypothetical protein AX15_004532 [Amanita polypyramis BW_CC]
MDPGHPVLMKTTLDAFVFNSAVSESMDQTYDIAPITQPNYNYLILDSKRVRADVLPLHHLEYTRPTKDKPHARNPRLVDVGTGAILEKRVGVYLHWVLPLSFRTGSVPKKSESAYRSQDSSDKQRTVYDDMAMPEYQSVPNRWLIIRRVKPESIPKDSGFPEIDAWVVESNRLRDVSELHDNVDTQVDVSPYVSPASGADKKPRNGRDFIGYKEIARDWLEDDKATHIDLTALSSSNQLFPDYQPQNGNVFSTCDNFAYESGGNTMYLKSCVASYLVFGWYSDVGLSHNTDPLRNSPLKKEKFSDLLRRLKKKHIRLIGLDEVGAENVVEGETLTLLWGARHNVKWSAEEAPKDIPAQKTAEMFKDPTTVPVAVGTGPLDALLAYIRSHKQGEAEELILKIQTLLLSQEDGVDDQIKAKDLLLNTDYNRFTGGIAWHLFQNTNQSIDDHPSVSEEDLAALRKANAYQAKLSTLHRTLLAAQWDLFCYWWTYLCDNTYGGKDILQIKREVSNLSNRLSQILSKTGPQSVYYELPNIIGQILTGKSGRPIAEAGTADRFYQYQDPTLLIAGLESGWPQGHMEDTKALSGAHFKGERFSVLDGAGADDTSAREEIELIMKKVMPSKLEPTTVAMKVVDAFLNFDDMGENLVDDLKQETWKGQPWCPLILEWEIEYYHIPFEDWRMNSFRVDKSDAVEHVQWGFPSGTDVSKIKGVLENKRTIGGRVLLLPQPGFSLDSKVTQLFTNVNPTKLNEFISEADRKKLLALLETSFPYMSCPLSGLTNNLLTMEQGTHTNPNERKPDSTAPEPTYQAINLAQDIGIGETQLEQVGDETGPTPYANLVLGLSTKWPAFKAATHGQFRFTKINIIDKFGQAISVLAQNSSGVNQPPIFPCISDTFTVEPFNDGTKTRPNTVDGKDHDGHCEFIQIPPRINQPARLNAHFLVKDESKPDVWRPADEWDNPIFGWLLINFANYSLQVFLKDGRFYREIRLGGGSGLISSPPWLPFSSPGKIPEGNKELDDFLRPMMDTQDPTYLQAVYQLILNAFQNTQEVPGSYSEYLSSIVGKPVVLTNVGFSLELSVAPKGDKTLYKSKPTQFETPIQNYDVRLKIGDEKRVYDGLIGYLEPGKPDAIYTYYGDQKPLTPITPDSYLTLNPFFIDPKDTPPEDYTNVMNSKLQRRIAILDPFVALHGYTGGLVPIVGITLPPWTVETALKKMTVFLQMGPVLATKDVPQFNEEDKLKEGYTGDVTPFGGQGGPGLSFPAGLKKEEWIWLQPYATGDEKDQLEYMALNLGATEEVARFEPAPYSAVEGYLQLKRPLGGMPPPPPPPPPPKEEMEDLE